MRENLTYGSEGGEGLHPFPTPIGDDYCIAMSADQATAGRNASRIVPSTRVRMSERTYASLRKQVQGTVLLGEKKLRDKTHVCISTSGQARS